MAVCDGHANLLISMLRSLGYNAYYIIGYAYTEEDLDPDDPNYWGPHGWVEVEYQGKAISLDPTWQEHPVDATHIKFAAGPDSNYTEHVNVMANNVEVNWDSGKYKIRMIDSETMPRIDIDSRLVPETLGSTEHSLLITNITSNLGEPCVLTKVRTQTCSNNGEQFLDTIPDERDLGFCGSKTLYWFLGTPELGRGVEYSCVVNTYGGGDKDNITLTAAANDNAINIRMFSPKVLTPGQVFTVNTTVENTGLLGSDLEIFLVIHDSMQQKAISLAAAQSADNTWTVSAPQTQGMYTLRVFLSSGMLLEEDIRVVKRREAELTEVSMPENISLGAGERHSRAVDVQFNTRLFDVDGCILGLEIR